MTKPTTKPTIGQCLRRLRKSKGLSISQLRDLSGVHWQTIQSIEDDTHRRHHPRTLLALFDALGAECPALGPKLNVKRLNAQQDFGDLLRRLRHEQGLSLRELEERSGVPGPTISRIEMKRMVPRPNTRERLLAGLGVQEDYIRKIVPPPPPPPPPPPTAPVDIAKQVRTLREKKGLSLRDLEKLSGVHRNSIYALENEKLTPTYETAERLLNALSVGRKKR